MNHVLNFYDTKIDIILPSHFHNFKQIVSEYLSLSFNEVNELIFTYVNPSTQQPIFILSESEYDNLVLLSKDNNIEISAELDDSSTIIKQEETNINNELIQTHFSQSKKSIKRVLLPKEIQIIREDDCSFCASCSVNIIYVCPICNINYCEQCESFSGKDHIHPLMKVYLPSQKEFAQKIKIAIKESPIFKK